jgi:hypothetical protein
MAVKKTHRGCWALLLACALGGPAPAALGQDPALEYQVKAAYLFNFAKFFEWPAEAFAGRAAPLTLCIAGRDPFGTALSAFEGRLVQARPLRVRRGVTAQELPGCHMLFLAESEERRMQQFLRVAAARPIVTVSDIDGFMDAGGSIGLVDAEQRIQFEVNLASLKQANVRMNFQLLGLARNTRGKGQ